MIKTKAICRRYHPLSWQPACPSEVQNSYALSKRDDGDNADENGKMAVLHEQDGHIWEEACAAWQLLGQQGRQAWGNGGA